MPDNVLFFSVYHIPVIIICHCEWIGEPKTKNNNKIKCNSISGNEFAMVVVVKENSNVLLPWSVVKNKRVIIMCEEKLVKEMNRIGCPMSLHSYCKTSGEREKEKKIIWKNQIQFFVP